MRIILASNSPRRKELLRQIGADFEIIPSEFEEVIENAEPIKTAEHFAYMKAVDVAKKSGKEDIIIAADTIVFCDVVLGKPKNEKEAFNMLKRLSGREHMVITGFCVIDNKSGKNIIQSEITKVKMKQLTEEEINSYIRTGEPMDKAGSYGIQGFGALFVERIDGCYNNVVGLPIFKLSNVLKEFGVDLWKKNS